MNDLNAFRAAPFTTAEQQQQQPTDLSVNTTPATTTAAASSSDDNDSYRANYSPTTATAPDAHTRRRQQRHNQRANTHATESSTTNPHRFKHKHPSSSSSSTSYKHKAKAPTIPSKTPPAPSATLSRERGSLTYIAGGSAAPPTSATIAAGTTVAAATIRPTVPTSMSSISRFMTTRAAPLPTSSIPATTLSSFASSSHATTPIDSSNSSATELFPARTVAPDGPQYTRWWHKVVPQRRDTSKRIQRDAQQQQLDQELYVRSLLESYSSSLSSNRQSSSMRMTDHNNNGTGVGATLEVPSPTVRSRSGSNDELTIEEAMYLAQLETPSQFVQPSLSAAERAQLELLTDRPVVGTDTGDSNPSTAALPNDPDARHRRRKQRRVTQDALRAKQLEKRAHLARTRRKLWLFMLCLGATLSGFVVAAVLIATNGLDAQTKADAAAASASSTTHMTPLPTTAATPAPVTTLARDSPLYEAMNGTLPPRSARSGIDLVNNRTSSSSSSGSSSSSSDGASSVRPIPTRAQQAYTYVHCVLMSLSLWMSLVVIGMHVTFRSFRTYSLPLVLELSVAQCGYWITSLLRVQFVFSNSPDAAALGFCMAESFFNFGQISFACAIAFNMYRSVVSFADVLLDSHSAKQRYRTYTVNVMLLSLLGAITLSLVGYRKSTEAGGGSEASEPCLDPTCRLILYVYYPLLAFGFNFIFYVRFKRTIGESYPMSATGRLNKVARSYLVLFFVCWGSLITLTGIANPNVAERRTAQHDLALLFFVLQSLFDVLGVGTAVITLTNFHRCRKAFDFGLSLKTIDPHSVEFEDPVNILGEGTFALVLKATWRQGSALDAALARKVDVAVKTFKHTQFECLDQMKEEAYLSSKLQHPCVMMTYGCYTSGSNLYIVYEYLGGGTLQDVLDANASLPYETVLRYAHMIAMGMRFLHGLPVPIIHRDLKPLNCIFDSDQEMLKVADFGESRLFRKKELVRHQRPDFFPSADLTLQMTTNIGSACWAAPEVLQDEATSEYSVKVDVYSFGIMCWQLYTCQVPYVDIPGSVLALSEAVLSGHRPAIPDDCPTLFAKIMRRCWHESAPRRPSFEDIVQLLEMELADERRRQSIVSYATAPPGSGHLRRKADVVS